MTKETKGFEHGFLNAEKDYNRLDKEAHDISHERRSDRVLHKWAQFHRHEWKADEAEA